MEIIRRKTVPSARREAGHKESFPPRKLISRQFGRVCVFRIRPRGQGPEIRHAVLLFYAGATGCMVAKSAHAAGFFRQRALPSIRQQTGALTLMKFKVPVAYQAEVVPRGKRNPVTGFFYEWATIEAMSPSPDDAPVAVAWKDRMPTNGEIEYNRLHRLQEYGRVPDDGVMFTRFFEDSHYWFHIVADSDRHDAIHTRETAQQFQDRILLGEGAWPLSVPRVYHNLIERYPDGFPIDFTSYRSVDGSNRDQVLQGVIDQFRDNLIVVDNYIYLKRPEPVYMLTEGVRLPNDGYQAWIKIVPNGPEYLNPGNLQFKTVKEVFRIDRYEDAREASFGKATQDRDFNINDERKAEVLVAPSITVDTDGQVAFEIAKDLIERLSDRDIRHFSRDEAISYVNLRQAVWEYEQTPGTNTDAIFDAASSYRDCLEAGGYSNMHKDKLNQIIERHLMKPLTM
jgi:hypothetical protein